MPRTERVRTPQRRAGSGESPVSAGPSPPSARPALPLAARRCVARRGWARRRPATARCRQCGGDSVHGEGGRRTGVRGPHFLGAETDREGEVRSDWWPDG